MALSPIRRLLTGRAENLHSKPSVKGIIFDMDGTLTVPCIDFRLMYKRILGGDHPDVVNNNPIDILHEISSWSPGKQARAFAIITEIEQDAHEKLQIMPGAKEVCSFLDARGIRRGIITRNVNSGIEFFHSRFGLPKFHPALGREFTPCKPHPAPLLHICDKWNLHPNEVMMVGDSAADDIVCGNRAGAMTCLLDESGRYKSNELSDEQKPTHRIQRLFELKSILELCYDLPPPQSSDVQSCL